MSRTRKTALYVIITICTVSCFLLGINRTIYLRNFMRSAVKTTAIVTDTEAYHRYRGGDYKTVTIKYTVDDKEYEDYFDSYLLTDFEVGEKIDIYYQEQDPAHPISESSIKMDIIVMFGLGIFGIIWLIVTILKVGPI